MTWLLFILGAIVAGFVQGLTGFAFALIAMSFWVWVLAPQLAAPLLVFASIWSHLISLTQEQKPPILSKQWLLPYLVADFFCVTLSTFLLHIIQAFTFILGFGIFLVLLSPLMLLTP